MQRGVASEVDSGLRPGDAERRFSRTAQATPSAASGAQRGVAEGEVEQWPPSPECCFSRTAGRAPRAARAARGQVCATSAPCSAKSEQSDAQTSTPPRANVCAALRVSRAHPILIDRGAARSGRRCGLDLCPWMSLRSECCRANGMRDRLAARGAPRGSDLQSGEIYGGINGFVDMMARCVQPNKPEGVLVGTHGARARPTRRGPRQRDHHAPAAPGGRSAPTPAIRWSDRREDSSRLPARYFRPCTGARAGPQHDFMSRGIEPERDHDRASQDASSIAYRRAVTR